MSRAGKGLGLVLAYIYEQSGPSSGMAQLFIRRAVELLIRGSREINMVTESKVWHTCVKLITGGEKRLMAR
jgi:hypothetical protein